MFRNGKRKLRGKYMALLSLLVFFTSIQLEKLAENGPSQPPQLLFDHALEPT